MTGGLSFSWGWHWSTFKNMGCSVHMMCKKSLTLIHVHSLTKWWLLNLERGTVYKSIKIEHLFKTPEIGCHIYIFRVPQDTKLEEFLQMEMTSEIGLFAQMPYV